MFPHLVLHGTPHERGIQYGRAAQTLIRRNIATYYRIFKRYAQINAEQVSVLTDNLLSVIEDYDAALYVEMMGIAQGAGVAPTEIVMLNARSMLMSTVSMRGQCTAVAAVPPASVGNDVLLAQTWDWLKVCEGTSVVLTIHRQNGPTIVTFAEAGQVAKFGFNAAGLGLCLNWLESPHRKRGLPVHVLTRRLLQCETIEEVIQVLHQTPRAGASNFLIGEADGRAVNIETIPDDIGLTQPERGLLVHTNHYCTLQIDSVTPDQDSLARLQHSRSVLTERHGAIDIDVLRRLQRDHGNGNHDAICVHPDPTEHEFEQWTTLGAFVMNLDSRRMHVHAGSPCSDNSTQIAVHL